jgi:hypothetical protein
MKQLSRKRLPLTLMLLTGAAMLAACGEATQTNASGRITDAKPWEGTTAGDPHTASGWKTGDAEAWRSQIRSRMLNQNEYTRTAGRAP